MPFLITDRKRHNLEPGSAEWLAHRAEQYNAGDTGSMMGCGHDSRTDLLDHMHQGFGRDVSWFQQRVFDAGHRVEALARPLAERILGEELYPFVYSAQVVAATQDKPLLKRRLGASVDGAPLARTARIHWECKSLNDELRAALPYKGQADIANNDGRRLPKKHRLQMCQQALVRGSDAVLFSACEFDEAGNVVDERHCYYEPEPELCEALIRGWIQFEQDLEAHQPVVHAERPKGEKLEAIGLPVVRVMGSVVESNLPQWRELAFRRIEGINRELSTDVHFGQAIEDVKWCEDSEKALKKLKADVIGQMASVDEVVTTLDDIVERLKRTRRDLENDVDRRKTEIRNEVRAQYEQQAKGHWLKMVERVRPLNVGMLPERLLPALDHALVAADFVGAMRGLKTVKALHDKCNAELSRVKIALSTLADRVELNLRHFQDTCADWKHLFAPHDMPQLVWKEEADFQALCAARINAAKQAEEERRQREEAAAQRRRDEEAAAEQRRQEEEQRRARQQEEGLRKPLDMSHGANAAPMPEADPFSGPAPTPATGPALVVDNGPAEHRGPPTMRLGALNDKLGFTCTAAFLEELGFKATKGERNALLYHAGDYPRICLAVAGHLSRLAAGPNPFPTLAAAA